MILSEQERAANHAAFRAMSLGQKAEYIFAYYKLPLVLALIAIVATVSIARYYLLHKDPLLYVAYTNVELPQEDDERIFRDYLTERGANPRTTEVYRYYGLYLIDPEDSVDHQYSYASRLKLLAATDAEEIDLVIMSKAAYDLLSHSGYLLDLEDALADGKQDLLAAAKPLMVSNEVILQDNQVEVELGEADSYEAQTESHANALDVSDLPAFASSDLTDNIYLGIIANTPRMDESLAFLRYLLG